MILTVTLGPAVDKLYLVEDVHTGTVMRVKEVSNTAGGKGLNVSRVAALAGEEVVATGFLGGHNGAYVRDMLQSSGIQPQFTEIEGETRSCINIRNLSTGEHTEFLEPVQPVTAADVEDFFRKFSAALAGCAVATISGSAPKGVPGDIYARLIAAAKAAGKPVILDTSGELLQKGAAAKPTMIKPNTDEISQLLGAVPKTREETVAAACKLRDEGIPYVVVSLGADGSLMAGPGGVWRGITPDIPVVNTVGCGDSMVAGFAAGLCRGYAPEEMLRFATAISTANALTVPTGYFEQDDLQRLLGEVRVERLA